MFIIFREKIFDGYVGCQYSDLLYVTFWRISFATQLQIMLILPHILTIRRILATASTNFVKPTHHCGELRSHHEGLKVSLCGWLQHKRLMFGVIRDSFGKTQFIFPGSSTALHSCSLHSVVQICGEVRRRPVSMINKSMATGEIEVVVEDFSVLNACKKLPPFNPYTDFPNEQVRLKYRYLDFRSTIMQKIIRSRSELMHKVRGFLHEQKFVEIETPILCKQSSTGAHEFLVSSLRNELFYALPQSPQIFKQLTMIGGFDKYYQIARCFRDEFTHPNRQPEFTQIDLEMSFVDEHDIKSLIENLIRSCLPKSFSLSFTEMSYADAMSSYGTDKPDIRCKLLINGIDDNYRVLSVHDATESLLDHITELKADNVGIAKNINGRKVIFKGEVSDDDFFRFTPENCAAIFARGPNALKTLGEIRIAVANASHQTESASENNKHLAFVWVNDFPLFYKDNKGKLYSAHHPFTAPVGVLSADSVGRHFDLVLNGHEIGGGSIRIHDRTVQEKVLSEYLQIDTEPFHYFLNALSMGAPPHGGIALGLDRILAILYNCKSIRDVIAFPKSGSGVDLLTGAPSALNSTDNMKY